MPGPNDDEDEPFRERERKDAEQHERDIDPYRGTTGDPESHGNSTTVADVGSDGRIAPTSGKYRTT